MCPALVLTEKTMPMAHPASVYVMGFRMQHFIMHMVSAIVLMGNPFTNSARPGVQNILVTMCIAVTYALMSSEFLLRGVDACDLAYAGYDRRVQSEAAVGPEHNVQLHALRAGSAHGVSPAASTGQPVA